jgi:hypothetical protein
VVNKATLTGWTSGGNTAGIIKIGSYVYVGDRQNQEIQRYDLDLTNRQIMTKKNVPDIYQMIPGFHNGMATDSSDNLYILGYDSETLYADHYVYKFSISGTDLNYQSKFKFYDDDASDYLFDCNLGCDGTYLYINLGGGADQSNADKFVRRYVLDGSSYTDFSYTCSSYPYETGNSYAKKRNICVGIFRIQNKWWITEFYATQMIRNFSPSTGSIWANQYCFYLKNVTF